MSFTSNLNSKVKKMDWLDLALVKFSCIAFGVLLVIMLPEILYKSPWFILFIILLLAVRPSYRIYIKKD